MKIYSPADIAKLLNVKESTLRKYSILLENAGISFQRNSQNQRWYSDNDVIALQKLVTLKNNGDMSLKECSEAVYLWAKGGDITQGFTVTNNDVERYDSDMQELKEMVYKQNELIEQLSTRLDKQQDYISNKIEQRDQHLMQLMNDISEQKKEIAAGTENEKGFWSRLFNK